MSAETRSVLIDTSVWIDILRNPASPLRMKVDELVNESQARVCGAIMAELYQGANAPKDMAAVDGLEQAIPALHAPGSLWKAAGKLGQRLRAKGIVVGLIDCFLAALAMEYSCRLFSLDRHFILIAKHSGLHLFHHT